MHSVTAVGVVVMRSEHGLVEFLDSCCGVMKHVCKFVGSHEFTCVKVTAVTYVMCM